MMIWLQASLAAQNVLTCGEHLQILYLGETENFSERGIGLNHHKYECWNLYCSQENLLVSVCVVSSEIERKNIERELLKQFDTPSTILNFYTLFLFFGSVTLSCAGCELDITCQEQSGISQSVRIESLCFEVLTWMSH